MSTALIAPKPKRPHKFGPLPASAFEKTPKQRDADKLLAQGHENVLLYGGSRSGKTFHGVGTVLLRAMLAPGSRHAIIRQHLAHAIASIWRDTLPKVCRLRFPKCKFHFNNSDHILTLPNGSQIYILGLDDKQRSEKILGMEFATLYFNEITQLSYDSVLIAQTRLAQAVELPIDLGRGNREWVRKVQFLPLLCLFDCNPPRKQHWSYQLFVAGVDPKTGHAIEKHESDYGFLQMNPGDNLANIHPSYVERLERMPPALRKRFLEGEFGDEIEGALWSWESFIRPPKDQIPEFKRIVIGVDPPAGAEVTAGAECGIIVAAKGYDARGYILEDRTTRGNVDKWSRAVKVAYDHWTRRGYNVSVVGEINNGGDMVEKVIRGEDKSMRFIGVRASKGKVKRAEPIAMLYQNDMMRHCGDFGDLENQMTEFTPDFDKDVMGYSPDRVDALVWACSELMLGAANAANKVQVHGL